jgi:hypothetical protein
MHRLRLDVAKGAHRHTGKKKPGAAKAGHRVRASCL